VERALLCGAGGFGECWRRALETLGSDVEIVAVVEPDPATREEAGRVLGLPARRCLAPEEGDWSVLDATFVLDSSPPWFRVGIAHRALAAGLDALVAKPFGMSADEAHDVVAAASAAGRTVAVAQQMRYFPCFLELRRLIADGSWGNPLAVSVELAVDGLGWVPGTAWRVRMSQPLLFEASIHHFDLMRWCLGEEIQEVTAATWNPPGSPFAGDAAAGALLRTASGVPITYRATFAPRNERHVRFDSGWRVVCTEGVLEVVDGALVIDGVARSAPPASPVPLEELNRVLFREWLAARRDGSIPPFSGEDNLRSMSVLDACVRSADAGSSADVRAADRMGARGLS
jgi:predicted dehydrogenase